MVIDLFVLLKVLLFVAGIITLTYLALVFKNLYDMTNQVKRTMSDNKENIDSTIDMIPSIAENFDNISNSVAGITKECNVLMTDVRGDVEEIVKNSSAIMEDVSTMTDATTSMVTKITDTTEKVATSVEELTGSIADTTNSFVDSASSILDYFYIAKDIIDEFRRYFRKR